MDGQSLIRGTLHRNDVYVDDTGTLGCFVVEDRVFAHVELNAEPTLENFKHWKNVLTEFELQLENRGISRYYAAVDSVEKFRWCEFLGMQSNLEVFGNKIEIMVKEL